MQSIDGRVVKVEEVVAVGYWYGFLSVRGVDVERCSYDVVIVGYGNLHQVGNHVFVDIIITVDAYHVEPRAILYARVAGSCQTFIGFVVYYYCLLNSRWVIVESVH